MELLNLCIQHNALRVPVVSPQRTTPPASLTTKLSAVNSTPCFLFREKSMIWCVLHLKATPRNESTDEIKAVNSRGPLLFYKHWWVSWPGFVIVFFMFLVGYFQFNSVFYPLIVTLSFRLTCVPTALFPSRVPVLVLGLISHHSCLTSASLAPSCSQLLSSCTSSAC